MLTKDSIINLFHIFFVFPILCYIYYLGFNKKLNSTICRIILILSTIGILYHIYLIKKRIGTNEQYKIWVNLIHIFIVFPLLIYIAFKCEEIKRPFLEMLLILAFSVLGYHAFNFIRYI